MPVNDDDKKVMDVASPSETKPDTGSKPMVVGHKFLSADPTVKESEENQENSGDSTVKTTQVSPRKKIVLAPISDNIKTDEETTEPKSSEPASENPKDDVGSKTEDQTKEASEAGDKQSDNTSADDTKEKTAEQKQSEQDKLNQEKEDNLREIIKSKEYFVPIKHQGASAFRTFIITFALVCLLGVVALGLLIDAEIVDMGVDLPFDFL